MRHLLDLLFRCCAVALGCVIGIAAAHLLAQPMNATYRHRGAALLPDPRITPGIATGATAAQLCSPSFRTGSVRNVPESEKHEACAEYGVKQCDKHVEIDHLISLELGGSNDIRNLWPEPYLPNPGAHTKDALEDRLHAMVCRSDIGLAAAQRAISTDWYAAYKRYVK